MAATGYTPIQLYYSTTAAAVPTAGNLASGELAINITDGKLYYKSNAGVVTLLAGATAGPAGGSNTQVQFNSSGALAGSSNMTFDGTTLTANALTVTNAVTLSGGTANGVAYLNGSKVVTSGSALTYNGTTLTATATTGASVTYPAYFDNSGGGVGTGSRIGFRNTGVSYGEIGYSYTDAFAFDLDSAGSSRTRFLIGGAEQMRLTSTGLGIGTSSPSAKLGVAGNIFISGATPYIAFDTTQSGSTPAFIQYASSALVFGTGSSERMRLDSSGNLGIGTTSPSKRLDVVTSSNSGTETQLSLRNTSNGTNVSAGVAFGFNTVAADPDVLASIYGLVTDRNTRNGALTFSTAASATLTERARIASNGNMGIGATSPATRLYVDQGADSNGISLAYSVRGASRTEWELSGVSNENCSWIHNNGTNRFVMQTIGRDNVVWRTNDTERARIDSSGRIAFSNNGTSSDRLINAAFSGATTSGSNQFGLVLNPTYPNTVTSTLFNMYTGPNLTAGTTVTTVYGHYLEAINAAGSTVTNRWGLYQAGGSDKNYFAGFLFTGSQTNWNNSTQGSFTGASSGGGVGVYSFSNLDTSTGADASPSLVMNKGSATTSSSQRFIQFYSGGSSAQAMGGIVGNGAENVQFLTLSDEREKTNIAPVTGALSRIMQIQVSSFDRIGSNEHVKAGFVAQNVLPIYPEYVVENASNKGKEPRYGITGGMSAGFVAELTAALQELKAEFDAYKASHP